MQGSLFIDIITYSLRDENLFFFPSIQVVKQAESAIYQQKSGRVHVSMHRGAWGSHWIIKNAGKAPRVQIICNFFVLFKLSSVLKWIGTWVEFFPTCIFFKKLISTIGLISLNPLILHAMSYFIELNDLSLKWLNKKCSTNHE